MKDKPARALAIIALVFMGIFLVSFTATLIDYTWLGGSVGIIALCSGIVVLLIFIALKIDGRGFSLTEMKNESEMKKIEQVLMEQEEREKLEKSESEEQPKEQEIDNAESSGTETEKPSEDNN